MFMKFFLGMPHLFKGSAGRRLHVLFIPDSAYFHLRGFGIDFHERSHDVILGEELFQVLKGVVLVQTPLLHCSVEVEGPSYRHQGFFQQAISMSLNECAQHGNVDRGAKHKQGESILQKRETIAVCLCFGLGLL